MSRRIGALVIHGMGSQRPGYSADLVRGVARRLGDREDRLVWKEVHWAYALSSRENALWDAMNEAREPDGDRIPLDWRSAREFVIHNFGDAVAYHRDASSDSAYRKIHRIVSGDVAAMQASLADEEAPVVVLAHSLGAHIISNYLWDRQNAGSSDDLEPIPNLLSMVTFGCNIPLFSLAFEVARPIQLPGDAIGDDDLAAAARWMNFTDRDDVLGWPLRALYEACWDDLTPEQQETVQRIEDYEINVGGLLTAWNPGAHTAYDGDHDMIRPVADHLKEILDILDA